jgi:hypothetical protein
MKKFVKGLITNRLGIVLAALNVCYFLSENTIRLILQHSHAENCLTSSRHILFWMQASFSKLLFANINSPAILLSILPGKFIQMNFPDLCVFTLAKFQIIFFLFFITLQWLFIGWMAKTIARRIRPNLS